MIEKITLDMLTQDSVSVKTQKYVEVEGTQYPIGEQHRKAYINSTRGRSEIENELPQEYKNAVFAVWGNEPTIVEDVDDKNGDQNEGV